MLRSLYIVTSGMMANRKIMDNLSSNISNAETTGYKQDKMVSRSFNDMLIERINDPAVLNRNRNFVGPLNTGIHIDEIITDFSQGVLEPTDNPLDLALVNEGFFVVNTQNGLRYTRDGALTLNVNGYLTTGDGNLIMGQNGAIQLGTDNFTVDPQGNIFVNNNFIDRIRVVNFNNLADLRKQGDNLYYSYSGQQPVEAENYGIRQGFIEGSNLDTARAMVDMISVYRTYQTNQRMAGMIDETLGQAVNDIGRVK